MEALGVDAKLLLAQIINFVILFIIFQRFVTKPFRAFLNDEKKKAKEKETILEELQKKEEKMKAQEKEIISEANVKAGKIIDEAKKTATQAREEIVKKAHEEAVAMHEKAEKQIEEERKKLLVEVKNHLVQTSAQLTEAVLKELVDRKTQEEMVKKVVSSLDKKAIYEN